MVGSIREILKIKKPESLAAAFEQLEQDMEERLKGLENELDKNILSSDVIDTMKHMTWVESWRNKVSRYQYLVSGFVEYSKSSQFSMPAEKGVTEAVRDAWKKSLSGPYVALQSRLDNLIESIDSRVNVCKKVLGTEMDGEKNRSRFAA